MAQSMKARSKRLNIHFTLSDLVLLASSQTDDHLFTLLCKEVGRLIAFLDCISYYTFLRAELLNAIS